MSTAPNATKTDTATLLTFFLAGVGTAYAISKMMEPPRHYRMVSEALGPVEEYGPQGEELSEEPLGEEPVGEEPIAAPAPIGGRSKVRGMPLKPGRVYTTADVPGADIANFRPATAGPYRKTKPAPPKVVRAPKTVPAVPKPKVVAPVVAKKVVAPVVTKKVVAPVVTKKVVPVVKKAAASTTKTTSINKALVRESFLPEIDSRGGFTVIPR
jgi:hypothetical protein